MAEYKKKSIKVYSYLRVSTSMQVEGFSLDAQREELKDYAKRNHMIIVKEYSDEGVSGKNITFRKGFQTMMYDVINKKDDIRYVITYELSRFGRNAADVINCVQNMQDNGVDLITLKPAVNSSDEFGKLMISVMSSIAEMEKETIRTHTKNGRIQKAREGKWNGAQAPYGYFLDNGELKINEEEAKTIRLIFDLYVNEGLGAVSIVNRLQNLGIKKVVRQNGKSNVFNASFVRRVLNNPVYKGYIVFGKRTQEKIEGRREEYRTVKQTDPEKILINKGIHEAIVSEEIWNLAYDKKVGKGGRKEKEIKEHEYILSGLVKCPHCGKNMYGICSKKEIKNGKYSYSYAYKCRQKSNGTGVVCPGSIQYNCKELDREVEQIVLWHLRGTEILKEIKEQSKKEFDVESLKEEYKKHKAVLNKLEAKKRKIEKAQDDLDDDDPTSDYMFDSYDKRLKEIFSKIIDINELLFTTERKIKEVDERRIEWEKSSAVIIELMNRYNTYTDSEKKRLLNRIIKSVEVYPDKRAVGYLKSIEFAFPIFKSNLTNEKDTIYTVQDEYPNLLDENGEFTDYDPSEKYKISDSETEVEESVTVYPDETEYFEEYGCLPPEHLRTKESIKGSEELERRWKNYLKERSLEEEMGKNGEKISRPKETTVESVALLVRK